MATLSTLHRYPPSECAIEVRTAYNAIAMLDTEILELETRLAKCSEQRCALKAILNEHHDRLLHSFPLEISSHIFGYVVSNSDDDYGIPPKSHELPVLVLAAVCKRWREIALGTPQLWTRMTINLWRIKSAEHFETTKELIGRSTPHPLFLKINMTEPNCVTISQALERISWILNAQLGRWKGLNLYCLPQSITRTLLDGVDQDVELDSLEINMSRNPTQSSDTLPLLSHARFDPKTLYLNGISILLDVPLRYQRLTRLDTILIALDEALYIIQNAPNLHTARLSKVSYISSRPAFPMPTNPIIHTSLTNLEGEYMSLLRFVTLPALKYLGHNFYTIRIELDGFFDCIQRSGFHSLTHLYIRCDVDEPQNVYTNGHWYQDIPSLIHLRVVILPIFPVFSARRTPKSLIDFANGVTAPLHSQRQPLAFPLLEEFYLATPLFSKETWSHLHNMIRLTEHDISDTRRPIRLISVSAFAQYSCDDNRIDLAMSKEDCIGFLQLQKSGLKLDFKSEGRNSTLPVDLLDENRVLLGIPEVIESDELLRNDEGVLAGV